MGSTQSCEYMNCQRPAIYRYVYMRRHLYRCYMHNVDTISSPEVSHTGWFKRSDLIE